MNPSTTGLPCTNRSRSALAMNGCKYYIRKDTFIRIHSYLVGRTKGKLSHHARETGGSWRLSQKLRHLRWRQHRVGATEGIAQPAWILSLKQWLQRRTPESFPFPHSLHQGSVWRILEVGSVKPLGRRASVAASSLLVGKRWIAPSLHVNWMDALLL